MRITSHFRHFAGIARWHLYVAAGVAVIGIVAWYQLSPGSDLAANFLAEAVGIFVTVAGIDVVLRATHRREARPARYAAYLATTVFLNNFRSLWLAMLIECSITCPADDEDMFCAKFQDEVSNYLKLDALSKSIVPPMPWRSRIPMVVGELKERIDRIQTRYTAVLDPEVMLAFHRIETSAFFGIAAYLEKLPDIAVKIGAPTRQTLALDSATWRELFEEFELLRQYLHREAPDFKSERGYLEPPGKSVGSALRSLGNAQTVGTCRVA